MPQNITKGDCVTLIAAGNDSVFTGWQEHGSTISQEDTLTFIATENRDIIAKFDESTITYTESKSPSDTNGVFFFYNLSPYAQIALVLIFFAIIIVVSITVILIVKLSKKEKQK